MNFNGNLGSLFLPNLLQMLHKDGVGGVLNILHPDGGIRIFFENGNIVYSQGEDRSMQLLQLMARKGLLPPEQQSVVDRFVPDTEFKLGSYLIKNHLISLDTWQKYTKITVDESLLKAFLIDDADFKFEGKPPEVPDIYKVRINLMQLILDITRKIDELKFVKKHIPDAQIVFTINDLDEENKTIQFSRSEWAVLSKVDGKRSVEEIIEESQIEEFTVYKILYSLITSGLIKRSDDVALNTKGDFVDYEGILTLYLDLVKIVERNFRKEVGKQFYKIYARCFDSLEPDIRSLIDGFDPFNEESLPVIQSILKRLGRYHSFSAGKEALLRSLNALLHSLLDIMQKTLGPKLKEATVHELTAAVSFVGKHQPRSDINMLVLSALKKLPG